MKQHLENVEGLPLPRPGCQGTHHGFPISVSDKGALWAKPAAPLPWDFHPQENPSLSRTGGAIPELDRMATSRTLPSPPLRTVKTSACCQCSTNINLSGGDYSGLLGSHPLSEACPTFLFQMANRPSCSPTCTLTPHTGLFCLSFKRVLFTF
ncbi:unnamed protein product [Rangifer tarandus platyrhynchus]|uniref:Uncharacterized protein n=1 Tax=Rangifer tarandus platyrhynchus TaxID=3082113 RepID=A0ABN8ZXJ2_RANTA|nr:unnamed protein product [Rangifer tarandus platyrhynchus]